MPGGLHLTKIAFGSASAETLRAWLEAQADGPFAEARLTTRYVPKRLAELEGGSLYWIHHHVVVGRSPLLGFEQRPDGKWWIRLAPTLVAVHPYPRRAHQGWRYLNAADAPPDLAEGEGGDALPGHLVSELAKLGLV
ncbi:MAG: DUF1489 domain-containing protein [Sphingomonadales bacterium]|nr:DUF1489 domain-containing protein [Sphingomonadales bacterium]